MLTAEDLLTPNLLCVLYWLKRVQYGPLKSIFFIIWQKKINVD